MKEFTIKQGNVGRHEVYIKDVSGLYLSSSNVDNTLHKVCVLNDEGHKKDFFPLIKTRINIYKQFLKNEGDFVSEVKFKEPYKSGSFVFWKNYEEPLTIYFL